MSFRRRRETLTPTPLREVVPTGQRAPRARRRRRLDSDDIQGAFDFIADQARDRGLTPQEIAGFQRDLIEPFQRQSVRLSQSRQAPASLSEQASRAVLSRLDEQTEAATQVHQIAQQDQALDNAQTQARVQGNVTLGRADTNLALHVSGIQDQQTRLAGQGQVGDAVAFAQTGPSVFQQIAQQQLQQQEPAEVGPDVQPDPLPPSPDPAAPTGPTVFQQIAQQQQQQQEPAEVGPGVQPDPIPPSPPPPDPAAPVGPNVFEVARQQQQQQAEQEEGVGAEIEVGPPIQPPPQVIPGAPPLPPLADLGAALRQANRSEFVRPQPGQLQAARGRLQRPFPIPVPPPLPPLPGDPLNPIAQQAQRVLAGQARAPTLPQLPEGVPQPPAGGPTLEQFTQQRRQQVAQAIAGRAIPAAMERELQQVAQRITGGPTLQQFLAAEEQPDVPEAPDPSGFERFIQERMMQAELTRVRRMVMMRRSPMGMMEMMEPAEEMMRPTLGSRVRRAFASAAGGEGELLAQLTAENPARMAFVMGQLQFNQAIADNIRARATLFAQQQQVGQDVLPALFQF